MTCSWCKRDGAMHIGYGTDFDGAAAVLCRDCADRADRASEGRHDGPGCIAFGIGALYGFVMGSAGMWWVLTFGLGRW